MNSPWGIIFNLIKETSLTHKQVMWGVSWINIQMMMADAPRYSTKPKTKSKQLESEEDFAEFLKLR